VGRGERTVGGGGVASGLARMRVRCYDDYRVSILNDFCKSVVKRINVLDHYVRSWKAGLLGRKSPSSIFLLRDMVTADHN
jgi:hypothetical protein